MFWTILWLLACKTASQSNDLIVSYSGYYTHAYRDSVLDGALEGRVSYSLVPHNYPWQYSDFDVVQVLSKDVALFTNILLTSTHLVTKVYEDASFEVKVLAANKSLPSDHRIVGGRKKTTLIQISKKLGATYLWDLGFRGQGVKVGIFDSGLPANHPHIGNVEERTDWTSGRSSADELGHGTFVAGVIASNKECLGIAPQASLYIFKVFTDDQVSFTSWFLDAFNYAIYRKLDVINLSIGGPDFTDQPFTDKVLELTSNGITLISAIGNDGPIYGTLNNPADQLDILGVGGINYEDAIARFSSRGMTTWELPGGYGRMKPDLVTYGAAVWGSALKGGCRALSGTSVASPVLTGSVALLISTVSEPWKRNPAVIKQVLTSSATRLNTPANMFEQGFGKLNIINAFKTLQAYSPIATVSPPYVDMTECPYMWPYCSQPLYAGAIPIIINVTIINGMSISGIIKHKPQWQTSDKNDDVLLVGVSYSKVLWPWSGWLAIQLAVSPLYSNWDGIVGGAIKFNVSSTVNGKQHNSQVIFPIRAKVIATPPTRLRILWDQFHNLRYPAGYFPRDDLSVKNNPLDWTGDHIHTNFKHMYEHLRSGGYFVEVLGKPFTCFKASNYGHLLLVDPEEEFFPEEIDKIREDVSQGLNLIVFGDWYNKAVINKIKFLDDNTKIWWQPETGGSNIPALNKLVTLWNISLSAFVYDGTLSFGERQVHYASGSSISGAPVNSYVSYHDLRNQGDEVVSGRIVTSLEERVPISVFYAPDESGYISVYGDSNCLDSSTNDNTCLWLLSDLLSMSSQSQLLQYYEKLTVAITDLQPPATNYGPKFAKFSNVVASVSPTGNIESFKTLPQCEDHSVSWIRANGTLNFTLPQDLLSFVTPMLSEHIFPRHTKYSVHDVKVHDNVFDKAFKLTVWDRLIIIGSLLRPVFALNSPVPWALAVVILWALQSYVNSRRHTILRRFMRKIRRL